MSVSFETLKKLAREPSPARRHELMRAISTAFFAAPRHTPNELSLFDDIMDTVLEEVEPLARRELSERIADLGDVPYRTLRRLARDAIEVAEPVLTRSTALADEDLAPIAREQSQEHLLAIARRMTLSEVVTDILVERGNRDVVHSVVKNTGARFSDAGFRMLVKRSAGDDALATEVGMRGDIPRPHFLMLLEKASSAVRARLAAENPLAGAAVEGIVAEVAGGIRNEARNASPDFAAAQAAVERQNRIRRIGEAEIYQYARERKFEETAIALSILCDTPIDVVERALLDPGAEIVLILAKVAGLSSTTTKAILLLRAADRGMSANDLEKALASFNRLQPDTARRVLGFFRTRVKKPAEPMVPPAVAVNG